jgi:hypothetical protein
MLKTIDTRPGRSITHATGKRLAGKAPGSPSAARTTTSRCE